MPLAAVRHPDEAARENHFEIGIPNGASLILTHDADGVVPGLDRRIVGQGIRRCAPVFWGFRVMVGIGMLMLRRVVGWRLAVCGGAAPPTPRLARAAGRR